MKKLLAILLAVLMITAMLSGCGQKTEPAPADTTPADTTPSGSDDSGKKEDTTPTVPDNPEPEDTGLTDLRVGMFAEPSTLDPSAVALQANNCAVEACVFATLFDYSDIKTICELKAK